MSRDNSMTYASLLIIICVLIMIFGIANSYTKSIVRPQYSFSNFSNAEENERLLIEDFYGLVPELISEGKWFDVKLESSFSGGFTILKKVDEIFDITVEIEFLYNSEIVKTDSIMMSKNSSYDFRSVAKKEYVFDNVVSRLDIIHNNETFLQMVDEIKIKIEYAGGEEVHILKSNLQKEYELFELKLNSYYLNSDGYYYGAIREQIASQVNVLMITDFKKWCAFVEQLRYKYNDEEIDGEENFETKIVNSFGSDILTSKLKTDSYLSEEDVMKYEEFNAWYSAVVNEWFNQPS